MCVKSYLFLSFQPYNSVKKMYVRKWPTSRIDNCAWMPIFWINYRIFFWPITLEDSTPRFSVDFDHHRLLIANHLPFHCSVQFYEMLAPFTWPLSIQIFIEYTTNTRTKNQGPILGETNLQRSSPDGWSTPTVPITPSTESGDWRTLEHQLCPRLYR
jgi:hypothetical protein